MGQMVAVTCPHCGYHEPHLSGVGGQWGMLARLVTVTCTEAKRLVDVSAGAVEGLPPGIGQNLPPENLCPIPTCGSRTHPAWDPATAVCPACGTPGCSVDMVGFWD